MIDVAPATTFEGMSQGGWDDGWQMALDQCQTVQAVDAINARLANTIENLRKRELPLDGARSAQHIVAARRMEILAAQAPSDAARRSPAAEGQK